MALCPKTQTHIRVLVKLHCPPPAAPHSRAQTRSPASGVVTEAHSAVWLHVAASSSGAERQPAARDSEPGAPGERAEQGDS